MAETKKFKNPAELYNTGYVAGGGYKSYVLCPEQSGSLASTEQTFHKSEWDCEVTFTRKVRFFKKGSYVEATTSDVSYYINNGYTEVTVTPKEV